MAAAGLLRKRIVIEQPAPARDGYGGNSPAYSELATVWARIEPLSGQQRQLMQTSTLTATVTHRITIRYRDDLRPGVHRLRYDGGAASRYFAIVAAVDLKAAHVDLVITATEIRA